MGVRPKVKAGCRCIEKSDKTLASVGIRLVVMYSLSGGPNRVILMTERLKLERGSKKPPTLMAVFCPFCGKKYPEAHAI